MRRLNLRLQRLVGMKGREGVTFWFHFLRPQGPGPCHCSFNPKVIPVSYPHSWVNKISVLLNVWYEFLSLATKNCEFSVFSPGSPSLTTVANLVPFLPLVIFILLPYFMFYSTDCSLKLPLQKMSSFLCVCCSFPSSAPCLILKYVS